MNLSGMWFAHSKQDAGFLAEFSGKEAGKLTIPAPDLRLIPVIHHLPIPN
jgi:hypothetical protein